MGLSEGLGNDVGVIFQTRLNEGAIERRARQTGLHGQIGGGEARICQKRDTSLKAQVK